MFLILPNSLRCSLLSETSSEATELATSQASARDYASIGAHASQLGSFSCGPVSPSLNYELLKPS